MEVANARQVQEEKTRATAKEFWRAQTRAARTAKGIVLTKKKARVEDYYGILRAIGSGKSLPGEIISDTKTSWLTAMQCLRALEANGLVLTGMDPETNVRRAKLTEKGFDLLNEILRLENAKQTRVA